MTIPNDDSRPGQPASDGSIPPEGGAGSPVPPEPGAGAPVPPEPAPTYPPAPPAAPAPGLYGEPGAPGQPGAYPGATGGYPDYAAAPGAPVAAPSAAPSQVNIAFWLYIAAAVLSVVSGIITVVRVLGSRQAAIDALTNGNTTLKGITVQQAADASVAFGTVLAIITLLFWAITFVVFALQMRRGRGWARIVLTVLTVISLLNLPWGYGAGALQVIAAIVATILIWLRPASEYFAAVKASRAPRA